MDYQFKAEGFETLFQRMDELREEIGRAKTDRIWRQCLLYAMEPVLQDAISHAPYDADSKDGHLKDHIYMKAHRPQMFDRGSKYYQGESYLVRVTSSPIRDTSFLHTTLNKKGKFQTRWKGLKPVGVSQEFGNKRVRKHAFLKPALNDNIENIQGRLGQALKAQIDKIAEGKK